ncbi:TetR/AcrR family transcriptional regulator [Demequina aurantiaca]|uniref:TetR/AcrR family transcriptional regulator n=1 Tax=Demequina aurantiaca TaxID=676200 RepID=UPI003D326D1C
MTGDGRDTRWDAHRITRRRELVSHALRAIRVNGAGVGMDEIASRAGTSKTVFYRHFGDRAGLYEAVVESVHAYIEQGLTTAIAAHEPANLDHLATVLSDAYLTLVERDPEIYRFVMNGPIPGAAAGDPMGSMPVRMGDYVTGVIVASENGPGVSAQCAATWGHGLVGFISAVVARWMESGQREPRDQVVDHVSRLFAPAFASAMTPS